MKAGGKLRASRCFLAVIAKEGEELKKNKKTRRRRYREFRRTKKPDSMRSGGGSLRSSH